MISRNTSKVTSMGPVRQISPDIVGVEQVQRKNQKINSWMPEVPNKVPITTMKAENIGVVGMRQMFGSGARIVVRGFWSIILVSLFIIFLAQATNRVVYYRSNPVQVTTKIKRPSQLTFPIITICSKTQFNPEREAPYKARAAEVLEIPESEVSQAHLLAMFNITDLWTNVGYQLQDEMKECYFGRSQPCSSRGRFIPLLTVLGLCHMFVLDEAVTMSGPFNNFYMKLKVLPSKPGSERGWRLLVHNNRRNIALRVVTYGHTIYPFWSPDIQISMKEFHTLNSYSDPCIDQADYSDLDCELECFQRTLIDRGGCWLPFMNNGSADPCHSTEQYTYTMALVETLIYGGNWSLNGCGCNAPCSDVVYEMNSDSRYSDHNTTRIRIFYQDLSYQQVVEEWAYTFISLVCDIGGMMGLLLGASVLTFIEVIECVLGCCYKGCWH